MIVKVASSIFKSVVGLFLFFLINFYKIFIQFL
jgi:hypothetical protein